MNLRTDVEVRQVKVWRDPKIGSLFAVANADRRCVNGDHNSLATRGFGPLNEVLIEFSVGTGV